MLTTEAKASASKPLKKHDQDVGSSEVQVAMLTARIEDLTKHLDTRKKDHLSRRGLLQMVGRRKKLMKYLKNNDFNAYEKVAKQLKIRG